MENQKAILRNLITGERINVHSTLEHPQSSYGIPVWVDDDGNCYGEAKYDSVWKQYFPLFGYKIEQIL